MKSELQYPKSEKKDKGGRGREGDSSTSSWMIEDGVAVLTKLAREVTDLQTRVDPFKYRPITGTGCDKATEP